MLAKFPIFFTRKLKSVDHVCKSNNKWKANYKREREIDPRVVLGNFSSRQQLMQLFLAIFSLFTSSAGLVWLAVWEENIWRRWFFIFVVTTNRWRRGLLPRWEKSRNENDFLIFNCCAWQRDKSSSWSEDTSLWVSCKLQTKILLLGLHVRLLFVSQFVFVKLRKYSTKKFGLIFRIQIIIKQSNIEWKFKSRSNYNKINRQFESNDRVESFESRSSSLSIEEILYRQVTQFELIC